MAQPVEVCVTNLWEEWDYGFYDEETGECGETCYAGYQVETACPLPTGVMGWRYAGVVQLERLIWYDTMAEDGPDDQEAVYWATPCARGVVTDLDAAISRIVGGPFSVVQTR